MTAREATKDLRRRITDVIKHYVPDPIRAEIIIANLGLEVAEWFPIAVTAIAADESLDR